MPTEGPTIACPAKPRPLLGSQPVIEAIAARYDCLFYGHTAAPNQMICEHCGQPTTMVVKALLPPRQI